MTVSLACYKFLRAWDAGVRDTAGLAEALGVTSKIITSYTCRYRKLGYICDGGLTAEGEAAMEDYPRWAEGMARSAERPRSRPVTEQERDRREADLGIEYVEPGELDYTVCPGRYIMYAKADDGSDVCIAIRKKRGERPVIRVCADLDRAREYLEGQE